MCDERTIANFLKRLREACRRNTLAVEPETQEEAERLGFGPMEIENVLLNLETEDFLKRVPSGRWPGRLIWVFTPSLDEALTLWIRVIELPHMLVFSFHDRDRDEE